MADKKTGAIRKKRENKKGKKDSYSWENVVKELDELNEVEKWELMETKYRELHTNFIEVSDSLKQSQKHNSEMELERSHLNREFTKMTMSKTKMETLARELQKQNREIKEHNHNRLREEEERRKVVATSFTEKLNTLNTLMDENRENSNKLKDENQNMREKLKDLYNQFQEREQHVFDMNKQMALQNQLTETQFKKVELEYATEKEIWAKEKTILLAKYERSEQTNKFLEENVKSLQAHLEAYQKQFDEFESTIKHSNTVYSNFKDDMVKLQKTNRDLDKDRKSWKTRAQGGVDTILRMTEANETLKQENIMVEKKRSALEKLCRQLQQERMNCIRKLKEMNLPAELSDSGDTSDSFSPGGESVEASESGSYTNSCDLSRVDALTQTDFPIVVRRLPIRPPASKPDPRLYIELDEGQVMKFRVDIRHVHDRYVGIIERLKAGDQPAEEREAMMQTMLNVGPEDTDIILDIGVVSDRKIAIVANMGSPAVDELGNSLKKELTISPDKEEEAKSRLKTVEVEPNELLDGEPLT